jgi:hypothetical protein
VGAVAFVTHDVRDCKTVCRIDYEVGRRNEPRHIGGRQALTGGLDLNLGIQAQQAFTRHLCLETPDIPHAIDRLTVQIRFLDTIRIHDQQGAHASGTQILQHSGPQSTGSNYQDTGFTKPRLPRFTYLRQNRLAGIPIAHA